MPWLINLPANWGSGSSGTVNALRLLWIAQRL
jgi:hypothetical protein